MKLQTLRKHFELFSSLLTLIPLSDKAYVFVKNLKFLYFCTLCMTIIIQLNPKYFLYRHKIGLIIRTIFYFHQKGINC